MDNFIKTIIGTIFVISIGKGLLAGEQELTKGVHIPSRKSLFNVIEHIIPVNPIVKTVIDYLQEKDYLDFVHSKFASAGISKTSIGGLAQLPPEIMLSITKLIGTKWAFVQYSRLLYRPTALVPCGNNSIAIAQGEKLSTLDLGKLASMKMLHTGKLDGSYPISALSPNKVALGCADNIIRIFDIESGKCVQTLNGHSKSINALIELSPNILASSSYDKTIKLWDVTNGICKKTLHDGNIHMNLTRLSNSKLATRYGLHNITVWDIGSGTCIKNILFLRQPLDELVALHPNALALNGDVDIGSKTLEQTIRIRFLIEASSLAKLKGKNVAVKGEHSSINIHKIGYNKILQNLPKAGHFVITVSGNKLVTMSHNSIKVYDKLMDCDHILKGITPYSSPNKASKRTSHSSKQNCLIQ